MTLVRTTIPQQYDISDNEALEMQANLIKAWTPEREVLPLRYGNTMMAVIASMNGLVVNGMFRSKLKLLHNGFIFTSLFMGLTPSFGSYISHKYFITNDILLLKQHCTLCLQLKAAASACFHGVVYSLILAPSLNLVVAGNLGYRIPYLHEGREVLKFVWSVIKPHRRQIAFMLMINSAIASLLTLRQLESMERVTHTMRKVQQYVQDQRVETSITQLEMS